MRDVLIVQKKETPYKLCRTPQGKFKGYQAENVGMKSQN